MNHDIWMNSGIPEYPNGVYPYIVFLFPLYILLLHIPKAVLSLLSRPGWLWVRMTGWKRKWLSFCISGVMVLWWTIWDRENETLLLMCFCIYFSTWGEISVRDKCVILDLMDYMPLNAAYNWLKCCWFRLVFRFFLDYETGSYQLGGYHIVVGYGMKSVSLRPHFCLYVTLLLSRVFAVSCWYGKNTFLSSKLCGHGRVWA